MFGIVDIWDFAGSSALFLRRVFSHVPDSRDCGCGPRLERAFASDLLRHGSKHNELDFHSNKRSDPGRNPQFTEKSSPGKGDKK